MRGKSHFIEISLKNLVAAQNSKHKKLQKAAAIFAEKYPRGYHIRDGKIWGFVPQSRSADLRSTKPELLALPVPLC